MNIKLLVAILFSVMQINLHASFLDSDSDEENPLHILPRGFLNHSVSCLSTADREDLARSVRALQFFEETLQDQAQNVLSLQERDKARKSLNLLHSLRPESRKISFGLHNKTFEAARESGAQKERIAAQNELVITQGVVETAEQGYNRALEGMFTGVARNSTSISSVANRGVLALQERSSGSVLPRNGAVAARLYEVAAASEARVRYDQEAPELEFARNILIAAIRSHAQAVVRQRYLADQNSSNMALDLCEIDPATEHDINYFIRVSGLVQEAKQESSVALTMFMEETEFHNLFFSVRRGLGYERLV